MNNLSKDEETIFDAALRLNDPARRRAFLAAACADNPTLRQRIEELLAAQSQADKFFTAPLPAGEPTDTIVNPVQEKSGDRIGSYKLLQQIGEGGCGVVYMAEQEEPVRRRVALKIIKLGMDTKSVIARFEAERQALAMMDHPNIARVFDAGTTSTGRPFFVMELVRGIRITDYCDQENLSTDDRLALFIKVCHAIQHAHQKGIIHRDIKPSNILVTLHDGVPIPKVIDFGIAKATQQRLTDKTLFTLFEQFIGTPAYMSPEQAEMSGLDIDTRSDIYSLGVLLYELLTGRTPFDGKELLAAGLDEMRRTIREREPARPSTRVSTMLEVEQTAMAKHRHAEPPKLITLLRGDLDWIVMKALEKDRTRRYETASSLSLDLQRHLDNEPVAARPPSVGYVIQKLVRRHKLAFIAGSAVAASLIVGLTLSTILFLRERSARERAVAAEQEQVQLRHRADAARITEAKLRAQAEGDEQKAKAEAARSAQWAEFMKDMLQGIAHRNALGRDTKMLREILDETAQRLEGELRRRPEVEADMRETLGVVYQSMHQFTNAEAMHRQALALRKTRLGEEHVNVANSLHHLGAALFSQHRTAEAGVVHRQALALRKKLLGDEHLDVASSLHALGVVQAREFKSFNSAAESETSLRQALAIRKKLLDPHHADVATSLRELSMVLIRQPEKARLEAVHREILALAKTGLVEQPQARDWGMDFVFVYAVDGRGGMMLRGEARTAHFARCRDYLREGYDLARAAAAKFPRDEFLQQQPTQIQAALAAASFEAGAIVEAKQLARQWMDANTDTNSWDYGNVIHNGNALLGRIALREGNQKEAAALLLKAGRSPGSPQLNSFGPDFGLASELLKAGETAAVLEYLEHVGKFLKIPELERWREDIRAGRSPQGFRWPSIEVIWP